MIYHVTGRCVGEVSFKDYTQERSRRRIVVSSVFSFVFRTVSYVFKSEETGRSGMSDVPILRADPDITPLPICTRGEVSSEKISLFFLTISGNIYQLPRDV